MSANNSVTMETRSRNSPEDAVKESSASADAPSGFILKLYQMVNGAPDEVIAWAPAGDAFIIGSDLKRLESETLPQYFRHNRFQSLVRQLNFYSFRKINRERNVWIYKHELFHRDRPEDLHLVRRRTCPGLDGRKQRFSRYSARKLTDNDSASAGDDSSSVEAPSAAPGVTPSAALAAAAATLAAASTVEIPLVSNHSGVGVKREVDIMDDSSLESSKRRKRITIPESGQSTPKKVKMVVDTSLLIQNSKAANEIEDEESQNSPVNERTEMAERSLVISEVSKKLEQYARKAYGATSKGKRSTTGIVTPPFGSTASLPTTNLLTYDDEFGGGDNHGVGIVTDADDSFNAMDVESSSRILFGSADRVKPSVASPAGNVLIAKEIAERLLASGMENNVTKAAVASFCVTIAPCADLEIGSKILQLIASCHELKADFQTYRSALDPFAPTETMHQIWERDASRSKAVHDFAVFAVNCIHDILGESGSDQAIPASLKREDKSVLEQTILVWSKSL